MESSSHLNLFHSGARLANPSSPLGLWHKTADRRLQTRKTSTTPQQLPKFQSLFAGAGVPGSIFPPRPETPTRPLSRPVHRGPAVTGRSDHLPGEDRAPHKLASRSPAHRNPPRSPPPSQRSTRRTRGRPSSQRRRTVRGFPGRGRLLPPVQGGGGEVGGAKMPRDPTGIVVQSLAAQLEGGGGVGAEGNWSRGNRFRHN